MGTISELVQSTRTSFRSGRTLSAEWRIGQLNAMLRMLDEQSEALAAALRQDLNKPKGEAYMMEINFVRNEVVHSLNHVRDWMKPERVGKELVTIMDDAYIKSEPLGVVLVMGTWNYPLQLSLGPVVGAIAAGNCVILKPSEVSAHTAQILEDVCLKYLDRECILVINGGVQETTELLKERFDHIFYTGSGMIGKIVYEAAAKHLTPVTLELGGKSPVYIDRSSDMKLVARRLMWGKFVNSGQTCIAPDYVLCTPEVQGPLVEHCKNTLMTFFGDDPQTSHSFGRIINNRHFKRVKAMLENSGGKVAVGGKTDEENKYISPTLVVNVKLDDSIMQDEIFGPLLPFVSVKDVDEAINIINDREKPLAMYIFSKDKAIVDRILTNTSSGGVTVNDTLMHLSVPTLPFGGVGGSGMGGYHGKFSFDTFSHKRGCLLRAQNMERLNEIRYPPYSDKKIGMLSLLMKKRPKYNKLLVSFFPIVIIGIILGITLKLWGVFPSM